MLVCTGLLAMPVAAQAQFNFTTNNGAITITGYSGGGVVVIPGTTNGFPVTSIADNAFYNSTLTSVTIPISVTSIGNSAFAYCYGLTNIIIPNSVTSIGNTAFEYDYYLTSVTVGSGVTSIGFNAFAVCGSLTGAYFLGNRPPDNGTAFYEDSSATVFYLTGSIGWGSTFGGVSTALSQSQFNYAILNDTIAITGYTGPGGNVVIPATIIGLPVTIIGNGAFQYNYSLTNLTIGPNVTSIGQYVFVDCSSLTNVLIGSSVTNIGDYAFLECTSLRNLAIPDSVLNIGYDTFADCLSLTNVLIGNGVTQIGDYAFYSCRSLVSAYFQGNAPPDDGTVFSEDSSTIVYYLRGTTGWDSTFGGAPTTLSQPQFNYTINNGAITIIGYNGSSGNVVIPAAINGLPVASIGNGAFSYNAGLTNLSIPNSITNIGYQACYNCINLASVTIPNSVTGIGAYAFAFCHSLTGVIIPNSVISIGDYAFAECSSLIYAYFQGNAPPDDGTVFYADGGDSVYYLRGTTGWGSTFGSVPTAMSLSQFDYTVNNGTVSITGYAGSGGMAVIPDTVNGLPVTSIGYAAFFYNASLTGLTIGGNVTSIGNYAFTGCTSLTNITVDASNPAYSSLNGVLFDKALAALLLFPPGLGGSYKIPNSVTSIGDSSFYRCSLTNVTIPNSVVSIGSYVFENSSLLTNVTIGANVNNIGNYAFAYCSSLTSAYFQGNAPSNNGTAFYNDSATVYYLSGTTGWGSTFGGVLAVLLNPPSAFSLSIALTNMSFTAQAQNLFESDLNSGNIYEFITNGTPSTFASGLSGPIGLAFNSAGNLFELDSGSGSIYEFTNNAGTLSSNYIIFASGLNNPRGLAFDKNGNLFVANTGGQNILEFTNNAGALSTSYIIFASGLTGPLALAFNSAGNLFVSDAGTATYNSAHIYEYTPLGAQSTISALPTQPFGLAFDSAGDLFVTDVGNNLSGSGIIYEFTNNAGALSSNYAIFASGLWYPEGLAFDSAGNLFESDGGSDNIFELTNCVAAEKGTFASGLNHPSGLAFSPIVTNSTFSVSIKMFAEIILKNGQIGSNYLIQATANLSSSNWTTLTNITLPSQTYIYIDYSSYTNSKQFYRAVLQ